MGQETFQEVSMYKEGILGTKSNIKCPINEEIWPEVTVHPHETAARKCPSAVLQVSTSNVLPSMCSSRDIIPIKHHHKIEETLRNESPELETHDEW